MGCFCFPGLDVCFPGFDVRTYSTYVRNTRQTDRTVYDISTGIWIRVATASMYCRTVGTVRLTALATSSWRQKSTK